MESWNGGGNVLKRYAGWCVGLMIVACAGQAAPPTEDTVLAFPNAGFEDGAKGWSLDAMSTIVKGKAATGDFSLRTVDTDNKKGGSSARGPKIPITVTGRFEISGKVLPVSGSGLGLYVGAYDANNKCLTGQSHVLALPSGPTGKWSSFHGTFAAPKGSTYLQVWLHSYSMAVVEAYVDDLRILFKKDMTMQWKRDLGTIKERLVQLNLGGTEAVDVGSIVKDQKPDGSWADVDYSDGERTYWKASKHCGRLLTLARAYRRGATDPAVTKGVLAQAVGRGLDYWCTRNPKNPNWWWNVIGIPRTMYRVLLLAEPVLDATQMAAGCKVVANAKLGMTGQNLVWVAECTIARGCLEGDASLTGQAFEAISDEVRITTGEGVQPDYSFYQHGQQLYSGGYGKGFSHDCPYFAALAAGTTFAFSPEKVDIMVRYLLDGQQWMVRNKVFDYSACGRELARTGGGRSGGLATACDDAAQLGHPRTAELKAFAARLREGIGPKTPALVGNRNFWRAEYSTHHRPGYFASVRLASKRLQLSETCNSENMRGECLSDGVNYIYRTGEEYRRIMPVWDWRRLPGTTEEQTGKKPRPGGGRGSRTFAGGVSDGQYGLAAMDFAKGRLTARKAWFFFDQEFVCLGTGIACPTDNPVTTSLNQCLLHGDVRVADAQGERVLPHGTHELTGVRWVYHDGVAYVPVQPGAMTVRNDTQTGSWKQISYPLSDEPVKTDVFSAWIDHGKKVANGTYAYVVAPTVTEKSASGYAKSLPVTVLANRPDLQAAYHAGLRRAEFVFYKAGSCAVPGVGEVSVDQPCALMAAWTDQGLALSAANPEHKGLMLNVAVPGAWRGEGAKAAGDHTTVQFSLPDGVAFAGSTVTIALAK
jgi:chondroitin AC lyase